ncbi:MAG: hypothetical protein D3909_06890 [Candidatus Electrothrix sp. ATG1]|nr:hypothetical protein [Candidatus Electrothrix sp. ATG1]
MTSKNTNNKFLFWKYLFILCAIIFLFSGIIITPDLLIWLGPMRQTLTSSVDSIRSVAILELGFFRGLSFILSIIFLTLSLKGK